MNDHMQLQVLQFLISKILFCFPTPQIINMLLPSFIFVFTYYRNDLILPVSYQWFFSFICPCSLIVLLHGYQCYN